MRGGCSPQNNRLVNELRADGNKFRSASIRTLPRNPLLRSDAPSAAPTVPLFSKCCIPDRFWGDFAARRSFQSALTLSSFVLPDGVAALQNGSDVGVTNLLRGGQLRQCFGELEMLLRGSVCVTEFIPMRFRICRS